MKSDPSRVLCFRKVWNFLGKQAYVFGPLTGKSVQEASAYLVPYALMKLFQLGSMLLVFGL